MNSDATTTDRILDAAEQLFAARGFDGASVREITRLADVNVAAIHYHYGSKEAVLRGVTDRIVEPMNERRFDLLRQAVAAAAPDPCTVETLLDAFIWPDIETLQELQDRAPSVARFLGRTYTEQAPWIQEMIGEQFAGVRERFFPEIARALPDLELSEIAWRMRQIATLLVHLFATWPHEGMSDAQARAASDRLVAFAAPALSSPSTKGGPRRS